MLYQTSHGVNRSNTSKKIIHHSLLIIHYSLKKMNNEQLNGFFVQRCALPPLQKGGGAKHRRVIIN